MSYDHDVNDAFKIAISSSHSSILSIDPDNKEEIGYNSERKQQCEKQTEKTEIWNDEEKAMNGLAQVMSNVKRNADVCGDALSPSFSMGVDQIKNVYIDFKKRGVKIRFITEITKDNISYCKELMQYVELRHLKDIKGNMAVGETEYVATAKLEGEAKPITQTIYSNAKAIIEQNKYFFENLWINAISAEQRIKEIEEDIEPTKTEIVEDEQEISKRIVNLAKKSNELCIYSTTGGMRLIYNNFFSTYRDILKKHKDGKHKGIKWISPIENEKDIEIVKIFLDEGIDVRHIRNGPFFSFALSDKILNSTIEKMEEGEMVTSLLSSNDTLYLSYYNAIFIKLWESSIDAITRIKDIEEGKYINVELIPNPKESVKLISEVIESANEEVLILLSSENGFLRTEKIGGFNLLNKLAANGIKIRVLNSIKRTNDNPIDKIKIKYQHIEFRNLQFPLHMVIGITIIDRTKCMIFEIKDDTVNDYQDLLGLSIYIEGKSTALSYVSIFNSLWKQTELYDQLKEAFIRLQKNDKMQKEFINTAAHELRTPLQPILGFTEYLQKNTNDNSIDKIKQHYQHIEFRNLQFPLHMVIGITIIDRIKCMIFEIKDDTVNEYQDLLGLSIYIEGKSTALSYVSIFNSLWKQTEL
ncbi:MAG: histidine kinase dimerization/phospho-acceptor domain-containing protein, partial [Candidatus Nitrosocosmicus sp.]